jgi:phosphate transport system substrate-binding protein
MANLKNNDMAVSPVVATLVLIVVAVIGAVAVGTILGTFSSDVSKQTNAQGASDASATHILVAGSTTVLPASQILATDYENQHQGIKIDVQGGGSGAGMAAVGQGIADIGASSSLSTVTQYQATYPKLQYNQIGARSVVWIVNSASTIKAMNATDMKAFIPTGTAPAAGNLTGMTILVQRSDASGTESTAAGFVGASGYSGDNAFDAMPAAATKAVNGNAGVITEINGNSAGNEIGFVDLGYVFDTAGNPKTTATSIKVLPVEDASGIFYGPSTAGASYVGSTLRAAALQSVKDMNAGTSQVKNAITNYPQKLDSGLYYVTNGAPSSVVSNFIQYAQSPNGGADLQSAGDFSLAEIS